MLDDATVEKIIREYITGVVHMSLATTADGKPWVCEVHYAFDSELNVYWRSKEGTRHSREVATNPRVAGNIVEPHGLSDKPRGVYFEGMAEKLPNVDETSPAYVALNDRFGRGAENLEDARNEDGHQYYKITVSDWYLFDTRESKPSQKYHLLWPR